jgi:diamine N-acetyltransferase
MENNLIKLRALEPNDIDLLYETENDPALWELSQTLVPFSKHTLNQYIKDAGKDIFTCKQVRMVIVSKSENCSVGFIDLFDYDPINLRAGIGIVIIEKYRRKTYAENAIELIKAYAFKVLRLNQLYCDISEDNNKSLKLFQKAGFQISGRKLKWLNAETHYKDVQFLQCFSD